MKTKIMSKGFAQNQHRSETLRAFTKNLVRRSKSRCELCEGKGVPLEIYEVPPHTEEPDITRCVLLCETCRTHITAFRESQNQHWLCLHKSAWSDIPAVQVLAVRLLKKLSKSEHWARDLAEQLYISPEVQNWAEEGDR